MTPTNPKTPSLRERIELAVIRTASPDGTKTIGEAVDDILLAVKEELPKKEKHDIEDDYTRGRNDCREEMERRLE